MINNKPLALKVLIIISSLLELAFLGGVVGFIHSQPAQAASAPAAGSFISAPCMFSLPLGIQGRLNFQCGYVTVPLFHAKPDGDTIQLAVAILKSSASNPAPDPLFLAQGGPGGSTIDTFVQLILTSSLYSNRDIVLFDQRGTYYSKPFLDCPEEFDLTVKTLDQVISAAESMRLGNEAALACRKRLIQQGVDLSAYNSLENAADIDSVRQALGYEKIDLYGVSYGTMLALTTMRNYPQDFRAVILDAVVPPQVNFLTTSNQTENHAFEELFNACAQATNCRSSYPDLRTYFYQLVDRLNKTPVTFNLVDPKTSTNYKTLMDGDSFVSIFFQMIYSSELLPFLPKMIWNVGHGGYGFIQQIMPIFIFDRTMSNGMYYSVTCAENADYDPQKIDLGGLPPQLSKNALVEAQGFVQLCQSWGIKDLAPQVDQPVSSEIPTLILNGRFDPITPPENGALVASTLKNSYVYTFPNSGHGSAFSSDCAMQIVLDFLNDPSQAPNSACIARIPPVQFVATRDVLELPVVYRILNLKDSILTELIIYGLAVLLLASAIVIYPLAWLVKAVQRKPVSPIYPVAQPDWPPVTQTAPVAPHRPSLAARLAPWLAVLNGLATIVYSIGMVILLVVIVMDKQNLYLVGVPGASMPLFILPLLIALFSIGMLVLTYLAWRRHEESLKRRLYFTLLTIAALGCTSLLTYWGMMTILF